MVGEYTGLIENDVLAVLEYLFTNYGKVASEKIKQLEGEVLALSFNPVEPMITIYRPIKKLQKKATEAVIPYSEAQNLEFGLTLIRSTIDFETALRIWNSLTVKAWGIFKSHFRDTQTELK